MDRLRKIMVIIAFLAIWAALTVCLMKITKVVGKTRLGQKIEYYLSEPNEV